MAFADRGLVNQQHPTLLFTTPSLDQPEPSGGSLGGFNWWSQHFVMKEGKLHTHNGGYPGRGGSDPKLHRLAYVSITGSVGLFSTRVLTPNLSGRERDLIGALKVSTTLSVLSVRSLQVWTGMLPRETPPVVARLSQNLA